MTLNRVLITMWVASWFVIPQAIILHDLWKYDCKGLGGQPQGLECVKPPVPAKPLNTKFMI